MDPWDGDDLLDAPTVVAFDNGGVTGWAVWSVHPEALLDSEVKILDNVENHTWGQIDARGPDAEVACTKASVEVVRGWPGSAVLMEDFILQMFSKGRDLLTPVRLNAMLDYALEVELGIHVTHRQMPSEAKTAITDERLKLWGFYSRAGGMEHSRDADRHAILFLRKAKDPQRGALRRAVWWPHIYGPDGPYYVPPPKQNRMVVVDDHGKEPEYLAALKPVFQQPKPHKRAVRQRNTRRTG